MATRKRLLRRRFYRRKIVISVSFTASEKPKKIESKSRMKRFSQNSSKLLKLLTSAIGPT